MGPIHLTCGHGSCRSCFVEKNFRKQVEETECNRCKLHVNLSDIENTTASNLLQTCIDNLKVKCNNG